ncbi:MAG: hypothetical protein AB1758_35010, partial [Candidatus Eremiobacterota bacterium]
NANAAAPQLVSRQAGDLAGMDLMVEYHRALDLMEQGLERISTGLGSDSDAADGLGMLEAGARVLRVFQGSH